MAITDGLVACWDLDEASGARLAHIGGAGNTLLPRNDPLGVPGYNGQAAGLVKASQQYLYNATASPLPLNSAFSILFYVRPSTMPTATSGLLTNGYSTATGQYDFVILTLPTARVLASFDGGGGGVVTSSNALVVGQWNQVLLWRSFLPDPTVLHLQVNGGPIITATFAPQGASAMPRFNVGATGGIGGAAFDYFDGAFDRITFWNRALSEGELALVRSSGAGSDCTFQSPSACEPLPDWIAYGATGGPEWGTALFAAPGGWEQRTQLWIQVRGRWDVSFLNVSKAQATTLVDFFRAVAWGKAGSFCFMDWRDHTFDNDIATGDGIASTFQLVKVYTSGTLSYARPLTRPIVSSLVVTVNGVETSAYTVDAVSGRLLFAAPPANGAVMHASGDFEVLVRFETDQLMVTCVTPEVFSCTGLGLVELIGE